MALRSRTASLKNALALAAAALASPVEAVDWRFTTEVRMDDGWGLYFTDKDSIVRDGDFAVFIQQGIFRPPLGNGRYNRVVDRVRVDCRDRGITWLAQDRYADEVFVEPVPELPRPARGAPTSPLEKIADTACSGRFRGWRVRNVPFAAQTMFGLLGRSRPRAPRPQGD